MVTQGGGGAPAGRAPAGPADRAAAAQEHVREKRYSAEVDTAPVRREPSSGVREGRTRGAGPRAAPVLAALELCLHVLLRKIPRLSPALTGTPAAGGPGGPGGPLVLSDEDWLWWPQPWTILSHLPSIAAPEAQHKHCSPAEGHCRLSRGWSPAVGSSGEERGGWTRLLGAALNTVLDTWGNGAVDQVGVLRVLTVFLVSAGLRWFPVQPVLGSCLRRYTRAPALYGWW
ncbi:unnamed protein product [Gadus morhua 'NCC']